MKQSGIWIKLQENDVHLQERWQIEIFFRYNSSLASLMSFIHLAMERIETAEMNCSQTAALRWAPPGLGYGLPGTDYYARCKGLRCFGPKAR
jgi:hypothetical protein